MQIYTIQYLGKESLGYNMDLILELNKHITQSNKLIVEALIEQIKEYDFKTLEDLEQKENDCFTIGDQLLNEEEKLNFAKNYVSSYCDYLEDFELPINSLTKLKKYIREAGDSLEVKKAILLFLSINKCKLLYYKTTYDYIINGIL